MMMIAVSVLLLLCTFCVCVCARQKIFSAFPLVLLCEKKIRLSDAAGNEKKKGAFASRVWIQPPFSISLPHEARVERWTPLLLTSWGFFHRRQHFFWFVRRRPITFWGTLDFVVVFTLRISPLSVCVCILGLDDHGVPTSGVLGSRVLWHCN